MGAALFGVDVVGEREDGVGVAVVVLHRHLYLAVHIRRVKVDDIVEDGLFVLVQALDEGHYAALVAEHLAALGLDARVRDLDGETLVEIRQLAQTGFHGVVVEVQRLEDVAVGIESDGRARRVRVAHHRERSLRHAAVEAYAVKFAALPHFRDQPLGQRVDAGYAHAVQSARDLVAAAAELAARVQFGEHHFHRGLAFLLYYADRDAPAVVRDAHRTVREDLHRYLGAVARERLVDGVVHHLGDEMMKPPGVRRSDIHPRALSDGVEPLEHLDVGRVVTVPDLFHFSSCGRAVVGFLWVLFCLYFNK